MKTTKKAIFTTCHDLTKKIVSGTKYSYSATFTFCLRLYYQDYNSFCIACTEAGVDVLPVSENFEGLYDNIHNMDQNYNAEQAVKQALNFACFYGIKKRGANISNAEKYKYNKIGWDKIPADSAAYNIIQGMKKNQLDDIKQDIFLYLFKRKENPDFKALPDVVKLMRAGDAIVTSYYNKIVREAKNTSFSLDAEDVPDVASYDKNKLAIDDIVNTLVKNTPVKHRQLAQDIIKIRYQDDRKEKTISETANRLNVSIRTVKTVLKEMTDGLNYQDFVQA